MGDPVRVRSPLVEGLLVLGQGALANPGRTLTTTEEMILRGVFKDSLDYDSVRIALTNIGAAGRPYTFANTIRIPPKTDFNSRTLVHECTHVWQYQTKGSGYLSDSGWHQMVDKSAYAVKLVGGQSLYGYTAEQQAVIVESYYADQQNKPKVPATEIEYDPSQTTDPPLGWSLLPDVIRMIGELQRARPISDQARLQDRLYGPGPLPRDDSPDRRLEPMVPIIRLEFPWLGG